MEGPGAVEEVVDGEQQADLTITQVNLTSIVMSSSLRTDLRARRLARGWSQARMGELAGITRQSYAAIEAGRSVPSTEVSLRLARALGVAVENLFTLVDSDPGFQRVAASGLGPQAAGRVRTASVSGQTMGFFLDAGGWQASVPADGWGEVEEGKTIRMRPLSGGSGLPDPDLVVAGCDPAFGLVAEFLRRERGMEVLWVPAGSRQALEAVDRGAVHVAGTHMLDPETGEYNEPWVRRLISFPAIRVAFATWEQVVVLAPGNPLGVGGLEDLARPGMRFLNREPGSGTRVLLERRLEQEGIPLEAVPGFRDTHADGHAAVGAGVASGAADAGVAIRAVADARGLSTLSLAREPYELVVPNHFLDLPAVAALLDVLRRPGLQAQVEALGGYDVARMGRPG